MKVLIACEYSGIIRDAFVRQGHNAWSCDILPTESNGNHWQGDVIELLKHTYWDLMIAHPPCTYLANSGVRWLYEKPNRWKKMDAGAYFFRQLLEAHIDKICVENPIPHKYAVRAIGRKYDQLIQPWQFGHGETKATCLWLENLPPLEPAEIVEGREGRIWKMSPSKNRSKYRSRTYQGIANAMAEQWG